MVQQTHSGNDQLTQKVWAKAMSLWEVHAATTTLNPSVTDSPSRMRRLSMWMATAIGLPGLYESAWTLMKSDLKIMNIFETAHRVIASCLVMPSANRTGLDMNGIKMNILCLVGALCVFRVHVIPTGTPFVLLQNQYIGNVLESLFLILIHSVVVRCLVSLEANSMQFSENFS